MRLIPFSPSIVEFRRVLERSGNPTNKQLVGVGGPDDNGDVVARSALSKFFFECKQRIVNDVFQNVVWKPAGKLELIVSWLTILTYVTKVYKQFSLHLNFTAL